MPEPPGNVKYQTKCDCHLLNLDVLSLSRSKFVTFIKMIGTHSSQEKEEILRRYASQNNISTQKLDLLSLFSAGDSLDTL